MKIEMQFYFVVTFSCTCQKFTKIGTDVLVLFLNVQKHNFLTNNQQLTI